MSRTYRLVLPLLALWLVGWIILSWAAIQDDALIHLRYAHNLLRTHQITYDGVHASYGASSLLYVHLLALLSAITSSANLPRAVSTCAHLLLFAGMAFLLLRLIPARATLARLLGLILLYILATPSAVRWLDDGMETGLGLCFVASLCLAVFLQSRRETATPGGYLGLTLLAFFMVLLRTEFSVLCGLSFALLLCTDLMPRPFSRLAPQWLRSILRSSHLLLGCALALLFILVRMHSLLPDTALAKSDASWQTVIKLSGVVLASAMSFGAGLLIFWLLTFFFVLRAGGRTAQTIIANSIFPITLLLSAVRGQEIQGARYLVWTFFFSTLWNILELGQTALERQTGRSNLIIAGAYFVSLLIALPVESSAMGHVLRVRAHTLDSFEADHLDVLQDESGMAFDVGYIGYFSRANICDLAGLVNGRAAARLTSYARAVACANSHPGFLFLRPDQLRSMAPLLQLDSWAVCTHYSFANVRNPDTHYLLLPSTAAAETCEKISPGVKLQPAASLLR